MTDQIKESAEDLASDAAAIEAARQGMVAFLEFNGMNCNDWLEEDQPECPGWDGQSRRCECGNRRVCWEIEKDSDGKKHAVATAY